MTETHARDEICRIGRSLFERGYVHATAGNISVCLDDAEGGGFLITPTDACLGFLEPQRLARLDREGAQVSGDRGSKTIALHRRIYEATRHAGHPAGCIVHTHSTHCVAVSLANPDPGDRLVARLMDDSAASQLSASGSPSAADADLDTRQRELLPPITPYFVMKVGRVPIVDYFRPGDERAALQVGETIGRYAARGLPLRAVMLDRLGPNAWGDTPAAAMAVLEELEETARLWCLSGQRAPLLNDPQIEDLRKTFGAAW